MKKVFLGLMVMASLTCYADDQAQVGEHSESQTVCAPCEAAKLAKLKQQRESGKDIDVAGAKKQSGGKASASKQ